MPAKSKVCTKCEKRKKLECFSAQSRAFDGKRPSCKMCCNVQNATWRKANPDKAREANARWEKANPDKVRAKSARYRAKNRTRMAARRREQARRWYYAHRELALARNAAWRKANLAKFRAGQARWYQANREWAIFNCRQNAILRGE